MAIKEEIMGKELITQQSIPWSQKIRALAKELGILERDLGILLGYAPNSADVRVSELINGHRNVSLQIRLQLFLLEIAEKSANWPLVKAELVNIMESYKDEKGK
ncbi:MAG: hypothetical protein ONB55_21815 [candidate division KSB1 bacterium]|nr:hypothetical protein [candidate division KSB1 bacterium]